MNYSIMTDEQLIRYASMNGDALSKELCERLQEWEEYIKDSSIDSLARPIIEMDLEPLTFAYNEEDFLDNILTKVEKVKIKLRGANRELLQEIYDDLDSIVKSNSDSLGLSMYTYRKLISIIEEIKS